MLLLLAPQLMSGHALMHFRQAVHVAIASPPADERAAPDIDVGDA